MAAGQGWYVLLPPRGRESDPDRRRGANSCSPTDHAAEGPGCRRDDHHRGHGRLHPARRHQRVDHPHRRRWDGTDVQIVGNLPIAFGDYDITAPTAPPWHPSTTTARWSSNSSSRRDLIIRRSLRAGIPGSPPLAPERSLTTTRYPARCRSLRASNSLALVAVPIAADH